MKSLDLGGHTTNIQLGNIQYGQSRDMFLRYTSPKAQDVITSLGIEAHLHAELQYSLMMVPEYVVHASHDLRDISLLPAAEIAYHQSRAQLCDFLSSLFPIDPRKEEHDIFSRVPSLITRRNTLATLQTTIPALSYPADPHNQSLMDDINGQIALAVESPEHLKRWGRHFLLSLWDAHAKQMCNTFKDPGVQLYNAESPLFLRCQSDLIEAFDTRVTPVKPSGRALMFEMKPHQTQATVSMKRYNRSDYPCFAASSPVTLASGLQVPVATLRKGALVMTPCGSRRVVAVLKTRVRKVAMCALSAEGLVITPWHPVRTESQGWIFPKDLRHKTVRYSGAIYSVLLQADRDPEAHAIRIGGVWGVTLGHGATGDARAHAFLGCYRKVSKALAIMGLGSDGLVLGAGVRRDKSQRLADGGGGGGGHMCGFKRAKRHRVA
jgi:hypothetical protein